MQYLNKWEERIIGGFMSVADECEGKTIVLKWNNGGKVVAIYDSFIEDENDCDIDDGKYENIGHLFLNLFRMKENHPYM